MNQTGVENGVRKRLQRLFSVLVYSNTETSTTKYKVLISLLKSIPSKIDKEKFQCMILEVTSDTFEVARKTQIHKLHVFTSYIKRKLMLILKTP